MNEFVNYWVPILTMLISVGAAIWANYSSSRDCSKKIAAIEESTMKQIESIKKLSKLHAEISTIQMDKELWELRYLWRENSNQLWDMLNDTHNILKYKHDDNLDKIQEKDEKEKKLSYRQEFYMKQMDNITGHIKRLETVKKELELM